MLVYVCIVYTLILCCHIYLLGFIAIVTTEWKVQNRRSSMSYRIEKYKKRTIKQHEKIIFSIVYVASTFFSFSVYSAAITQICHPLD